jgi:hypothetical protein
MIRHLNRAFSSLKPQPTTPGGKFNILNAFKRLGSAIRAPVKHIKRNMEPSANDYNPMTNTTEEAFDEVSQEWQAAIIGNSYDVMTYNMLEHTMIANFGTVDNPHVIFTADAPFRYASCTGQPNEDDYEGHEYTVFMLREGPLQRCQSCGQVFKLVRLRDQYSPEMDYYLSNFVPYDVQEMGDMDQVINMSLARFQKDSYEFSQFETPSKMVYSLVNPDEHDRLLTDPAYRLERTKKVEEKLMVYLFSLESFEKEWEEEHGPIRRYPINKVDYETMIETEIAVAKMDRLFRKVDKFNNRRYIDRENHERREQRMQQRAEKRWESNYTIFYGGLTEEEQKYRDYFETDWQKDPEDEEIESKLDEIEVLNDPKNNFNRFDFQELYTRQPEEDASSIFEKKAFRFKYRAAKDSQADFARRNARMIQRQIERMETSGLRGNLNATLEGISTGQNAQRMLAEKQYLKLMGDEAIQQYKDYYESDKEEDLKSLDNIAETSKLHFIRVAENHGQLSTENKGHFQIPKRQWDNKLGIWSNFLRDVTDYSNHIIPKATELLNEVEQVESLILPKDAQEYNLSRKEEPAKIEEKLKKISASGILTTKQDDKLKK